MDEFEKEQLIEQIERIMNEEQFADGSLPKSKHNMEKAKVMALLLIVNALERIAAK